MGHLADGSFKRKEFFLADVLAEHAGEIAVGPRMGHGFEKHSLGRLSCFVRPKANPRQPHELANVVLGGDEVGGADAGFILREQVQQRFNGILAAFLGDLGECFALERLQGLVFQTN